MNLQKNSQSGVAPLTVFSAYAGTAFRKKPLHWQKPFHSWPCCGIVSSQTQQKSRSVTVELQ